MKWNARRAGYAAIALTGVLGLAYIFNPLSMFYDPADVPGKIGKGEVYNREFIAEVKAAQNPLVIKTPDNEGRIKLELRSAAEPDSTADRIVTHVMPEEVPQINRDMEGVPNLKTISMPRPSQSRAMDVLFFFGPVAIIFAAAYFFWYRPQIKSGKNAFNFGKSNAKMIDESKNKVTFADVAGVDEAKDEVKEIVDFLKDPGKYKKMGGRIPKGILVVGPPGTGKTLLARAVAGEAGVPFFRISGSDFVEMFVGVGASRVRDLFEQGKKRAPCIIFIDEIDAVGRLRGSGLGGGHDEREQTLNQLLVEMDGFDGDSGIILMAATNRPDVLDPALLRPGRFDRQVFVDKPDLQGREAILKVHMRNIPLKPDVDLRELARGTPGFSGADLENLANEAALCAARNNADAVGRKDLEFAKDKVLMGAERKSMILGKDEKERIAYHESGHAVMARHARHADDVHKVSIIPRNRSLGVTITLPKGEKRNLTEQQLRDDIKVLYAGRVAEEMKYGPGNTSIGAGNDIERSTDIIRAMVTEWGFSEELGPLRYIDKQQNVFLGGSMGQQQNVSSETAREIDLEMRRIAVEEIKNVRTLLREKNREVEAVAQALIEHETLDSVDIEDVLAGRPVVRNDIKMPEKATPAAPQQSGAAYDLPPP